MRMRHRAHWVLFFSVGFMCGCGSTAQTEPFPVTAAPAEGAESSAAQPAPAASATDAKSDDKKKDEESPTKADAKKALERMKADHKRAKLERELNVAQRNLRKAEQAVSNQKADNDVAIHRAEVEHQIAVSKLKKLEERDAPLRVAEARLHLRGSEDGHKEAEEELAQLEMMYAEEDLADKTREIVLNRGRRRLERARTGLANQQTSIENLEKHTLPLETAESRNQVEQKAEALAAARRAAAVNMMDKETAVVTAKNEIARIEQDMAELEKERAMEEAGK